MGVTSKKNEFLEINSVIFGYQHQQKSEICEQWQKGESNQIGDETQQKRKSNQIRDETQQKSESNQIGDET